MKTHWSVALNVSRIVVAAATPPSATAPPVGATALPTVVAILLGKA
jgi:hypothetical protein